MALYLRAFSLEEELSHLGFERGPGVYQQQRLAERWTQCRLWRISRAGVRLEGH